MTKMNRPLSPALFALCIEPICSAGRSDAHRLQIRSRFLLTCPPNTPQDAVALERVEQGGYGGQRNRVRENGAGKSYRSIHEIFPGGGQVGVAIEKPDGKNGGGLSFILRPVAHQSAPRKLASDCTTPIGPLGRSDSATSFCVEVNGRTPAGRGILRLEWVAKPVGERFDGNGIERTAESYDTSNAVQCDRPSCKLLGEVGTGAPLLPATPYHWRARILTDSPFFPRSPWLTVPHGGMNETKLVTAGGPRRSPDFDLIEPGQNEPVFADARPLVFTWFPGEMQSFRIEWSGNFGFAPPLVRTENDLTATGIGVFTPDSAHWGRALNLATSPDFGDAPVFWRIVARGAAGEETSVTRAFRIAAAEPPVLLRPGDGQQVPAEVPPTLERDANHNARYQVRFSTNSHLGDPRVIAGGDFNLMVTEVPPMTTWTVPPNKWSEVVALSETSNSGAVYFAVFARDALGRTTWSRVHRLEIVPDESATEARRNTRGAGTLSRLRSMMTDRRPRPPRK